MDYFKHEKAIVEEGAQIGKGSRIWANVSIQKGAKVGRDCNICNGSFIENGAVIGDEVKIKHNVSIFDGVTIEDNVFIGSNIAFINDRYPRAFPDRQWTCEKTLIKKGATLGANVVVLCGLTVGEYSMIGAGSVVTGDVPSYALMVGSPARQIGYVCQCGLRLEQREDVLSCECGKQYLKGNKGIILDG